MNLKPRNSTHLINTVANKINKINFHYYSRTEDFGCRVNCRVSSRSKNHWFFSREQKLTTSLWLKICDNPLVTSSYMFLHPSQTPDSYYEFHSSLTSALFNINNIQFLYENVKYPCSIDIVKNQEAVKYSNRNYWVLAENFHIKI